MKDLVRRLLPRRIRPHRILGGPLRGAWLVTSWHDYPAALTGRTERPLLDWFAAHVHAGETWLDIGAHYGYTAFALARLVGSAGRVFAFEPVPVTAGYLDHGRMLNHLDQVIVLPFALAAPETLTTRRLPLTRGMADGTLESGTGRPFAAVSVARFDWLWPLVNGGDDAIHGVKIDVQGTELETLRGMRDALRRRRPRLVVELHRGVDRGQMLALLDEIGYSREAALIGPAAEDSGALLDGGTLLDDRSYAFQPR